MAAAGARIDHIAQDWGIYHQKVQTWRNKWEKEYERLRAMEKEASDPEFRQAIQEVLSDEQRPGIPPKFTAEQICHIIAVACEDPQESAHPVSQWTPRELRDEVMKRKIVEDISVRHVGRFLQRSRLKATS